MTEILQGRRPDFTDALGQQLRVGDYVVKPKWSRAIATTGLTIWRIGRLTPYTYHNEWSQIPEQALCVYVRSIPDVSSPPDFHAERVIYPRNSIKYIPEVQID